MKHAPTIATVAAILVVVAGAGFFASTYRSTQALYDSPQIASTTISLPEPFRVTHVKTPKEVKALYMTSWVGGSKKLRDNLVNIIDTTELNAVVLDIKDYTGMVSFDTDHPAVQEVHSIEERITDIKEFVAELHDKNIYVIGRISAFQDSHLVKIHPEYAVKTKAGAVWKDHKGVSWLDAGAKPVWEYVAAIGDASYEVGFDELNFDYIRFPSDGNMEDIAYPFSQGKVKAEVLKEFFAYLDTYFHAKNITISADLFGMTTSNNDDLGIGQILENALVHFDFVAPMVYPSHYPKNFNGIASPAAKPYEIIQYAMSKGVSKAEMASTSPLKLRPWLQDFSIGGVTYTPEMVRAQIQATYDVGLTSWMMWNASNRYTVSALLPEEVTSTASH